MFDIDVGFMLSDWNWIYSINHCTTLQFVALQSSSFPKPRLASERGAVVME
jgi:hypothetical protein